MMGMDISTGEVEESLVFKDYDNNQVQIKEGQVVRHYGSMNTLAKKVAPDFILEDNIGFVFREKQILIYKDKITYKGFKPGVL